MSLFAATKETGSIGGCVVHHVLSANMRFFKADEIACARHVLPSFPHEWDVGRRDRDNDGSEPPLRVARAGRVIIGAPCGATKLSLSVPNRLPTLEQIGLRLGGE